MDALHEALFALVMPDIGEQHPAVGEEEIVVFQVGGQEGVGAGGEGGGNEEGAGPATEGQTFDGPARQRAVPDAGCAAAVMGDPKEFRLGQGNGQPSDQSGADPGEGVF